MMNKWQALGAIIISLTICSPALSAETTMPDYQTILKTVDLDDLREESAPDDMHHEMQVLDDEEHGTNSPDRLSSFYDLLKAESRTPEIDRTILAPWLIAYIWKVDHSNYTRQAWRTLIDLRLDDDELILQAARDILQHHPHGAVRAEVLQWQDTHLPHLEDEQIIEIASRLKFEDPHPEVRLNAMDFWSDKDAEQKYQKLGHAMLNDPSPEVRASFAGEYMGKYIRDTKERQAHRALLRQAVFDPKNKPVLPDMLRVYLSSLADEDWMHAATDTVNLLKAKADDRQIDQLYRSAGWLFVFSKHWVDGAPFETAQDFEAFLVASYRDKTANIELRNASYAALMRWQRPPVPTDQELIELFYDPAQTRDSMAELCDDIQTTGLRKLFATPVSPVPLAKTRLELLQNMVGHLQKGDPKTRLGSYESLRSVIEVALRVALNNPGPDSEQLLAFLFETVRDDPEDATFGLYDIRNNWEDFDPMPVAEIIATAKDEDARKELLELLQERVEDFPNETSIKAVIHAWKTFPVSEEFTDSDLYYMARDLPEAKLFADHPELGKELKTVVQEFAKRVTGNEIGSETVNSWAETIE